MLAGEPLVIRLSGLPRDAEVTLSARRTVREWTGGTRAYSASARFKTSVAGTLELASAVPLDGGSYAGADPRGLFWSMLPEATPGPTLALDEVRLEARRGETVLAQQTVRFLPVENIAAPVFVAGGHDDQIWDSGSMAENIAGSRHKAGRPTVALVYRDAGHALGGTGWSPTTPYNAGPSKIGGTPAANARAQAEVFPRVFEFLRSALGPVPAP